MQNKRIKVVGAMLMTCMVSIHADMSNNFSAGQVMAMKALSQVGTKTKQYHIKQSIKVYTPNPSESNDNAARLKHITKQDVNNNQAGKNAAQSIAYGPHFKINPNSSAIKKSNVISNNASSIISGRYPGCKVNPNTCKTTYVTHTCTLPEQMGQFSCTKSLMTKVVAATSRDDSFEVVVGNLRTTSANVSVNLTTGKVSDSRVRVEKTADIQHCAWSQVKTASFSPDHGGVTSTFTGRPMCTKSGMTIGFHLHVASSYSSCCWWGMDIHTTHSIKTQGHYLFWTLD